jgi:RNA polymerase sigma-70 factor, ECF subfamily
VPEHSDATGKISRGDEAAVRRLVDEHAAYLYGIAYSLAGNTADADDLVQETFAAALGGGFRGESSVRTWLVAILVRRAGMLRRSAWRRRVFRFLGAGGPTQESKIVAPGSIAGADARLDLAVMLKSLSPEHRAVIVLRELEGMSYEQMARTLGVPRGTVESRLHRAREELRKRFREYL